MSVHSDMFDEFLLRNGLSISLFARWNVPTEYKMKRSEKLQGATIGGVQIPVHHSVVNGHKLLLVIKESAIEADRKVRKLIKQYTNYNFDAEDIVMLCDNLNEGVLYHFLWPLEYLTIEAQLDREQFEPLAAEVENMIRELLSVTSYIYETFMQRSAEIEYNAERSKAEMDRQTAYQIANAPVYVSTEASFHEGLFNDYLEIRTNITNSINSAEARSMYLANEFSAGFDAQYDRKQMREGIMEYVKENIMRLVNNYESRFISRLKQIPPMYMVNRTAMTSSDITARPYLDENILKIFSLVTKEEEFFKMRSIIDFYEKDFNKLFLKPLFNKFMEHYNNYGNFDYDGMDVKFCLYYLKAESLIECEKFYGMFKDMVRGKMREHCMQVYLKKRAEYPNMEYDEIFKDFSEMISKFPGMDSSRELAFKDIEYYIYYDIMGSMKKNLYDKDGENSPVFIYDYEDEPQPEPEKEVIPPYRLKADKVFRNFLASNNLSAEDYAEDFKNMVPFEELEKNLYVVIGGVKIPANEAVANSREFLYYLIKAAKKNTESVGKSFEAFNNSSLVTEDTVNELCDQLSSAYLKYALKSVHYFTVETRLTEKSFEPLGKYLQECIGKLQETVGTIHDSYCSDLNSGQVKAETISNAEAAIKDLQARFAPFLLRCIYDELEPNYLINKETLGLEGIAERPYLTRNVKEIFRMMTKEDEFAHMDYLLWFYGIDFELTFGEEILNNFLEHYRQHGNFDYNGIDLLYYLHSYEEDCVENCAEFEDLFYDYVYEEYTKRCTELYEKDKYAYAETDCDELFADLFEMIRKYPMMNDESYEWYCNRGRYIFYDIMGSDKKEEYAEVSDDEFEDSDDEW